MKEALHKALLSAFSPKTFAMMLYFKLDVRVEDIAQGDFENVVFEVIKHYGMRDKLDELVRVSHQNQPTNKLLREFIEQHYQQIHDKNRIEQATGFEFNEQTAFQAVMTFVSLKYDCTLMKGGEQKFAQGWDEITFARGVPESDTTIGYDVLLFYGHVNTYTMFKSSLFIQHSNALSPDFIDQIEHILVCQNPSACDSIYNDIMSDEVTNKLIRLRHIRIGYLATPSEEYVKWASPVWFYTRYYYDGFLKNFSFR